MLAYNCPDNPFCFCEVNSSVSSSFLVVLITHLLLPYRVSKSLRQTSLFLTMLVAFIAVRILMLNDLLPTRVEDENKRGKETKNLAWPNSNNDKIIIIIVIWIPYLEPRVKGGRKREMGRRVMLSSSAWTWAEKEEKKGKQKQDSQSREQICGCQGGSRVEEGWMRSLELADANYYICCCCC